MLGVTVAAMVEAAVGGNEGIAVELSSAKGVESDVCGISVPVTGGVDGEADGTGVVKVSGGVLVSSIIAVVGLSGVDDSGIGVSGIGVVPDCVSVVGGSGSGVGVSIIDVVGDSVACASVSEDSGVVVTAGGSGVAVGIDVAGDGVARSGNIISQLHHFQLQHNRQLVAFSGHSISVELL